MKSNFLYRVWQFWQSLQKPPCREDWDQVGTILNHSEFELFKLLPVPDQNHSLRVLRHLESDGETDPNLLKAALLHDIGKIRYPLSRAERVFVVLFKGLFPGIAAAWREKTPQGIYRSLVATHQHPAWGAELAEGVGCNQRVIWLIRNHEAEDFTGLFDQGGVELLRKLQKADNCS